ncbi:MAG: hypothetical protein JWQ38_682 [Flavipsychrobacter sp.]|nr:hypothetical protein [Flavipsychrobacter sp.]
MKNTILLVPLMLLGAVTIRAQSVGPTAINAAGNSAVIGTNRFDWSVGEMSMVSTFTTPGIIITQGVLQPSEKDHTGVPTTTLSKQLQVFPNPASSVVNISYDAPSSGTLNYKLLDMQGRVVTQKALQVKPGTTKEQITIAGLACATYMLSITAGTDNAKEESASYKIEKIK